MFSGSSAILSNSVFIVYLLSKRENGERQIIMGMLALSFIGSMRSRDTNGLLYTQKKFGWTVTQYTNYKSFFVGY